MKALAALRAEGQRKGEARAAELPTPPVLTCALRRPSIALSASLSWEPGLGWA